MSPLSAYLPSLLALGGVFAAAGLLTASRPRILREVARSRRFLVVAVATILAQAAHFLEELTYSLDTRLPEAFGLPPLNRAAFIAFNVAWLLVWAGSVAGVRHGIRIALWPLWFLALGMLLNLVAHPLLAIRAGSYFPGLLTAPLVGIFGALLLRELTRMTKH